MENAAEVFFFNGNGDDFEQKKDDPERMATIKPQQPRLFTVVYPALRKSEPGYIQVYTAKSGRMWKIAASAASALLFCRVNLR